MDNPNAFSNYLKTTLNHGLSLSEADLDDIKRETTKHGPSLMEVGWGGKNKPNYTSSGCMLIQVDWGGKLRVNHINECMPSEVDWGAHETHQNGGEVMIQVLTLWMDACSLKLIGEPMIQLSTFTLCTWITIQSQSIYSPKYCGEDYYKGHLPPLSWSN